MYKFFIRQIAGLLDVSLCLRCKDMGKILLN